MAQAYVENTDEVRGLPGPGNLRIFGAKICLGELQRELDQDFVWAAVGVSGQHDSEVSEAEEEGRGRTSAGGSEQQEKQDIENAELAQAERLLRGAQRLLDLLLKVVDRHAPVLAFLVAQPVLYGERFQDLDTLARRGRATLCILRFMVASSFPPVALS